MIKSAARRLVASSGIMLFCISSIPAADSSDVVVTQTAYGALEAGQICRGWWYKRGGSFTEPISHVWQQRAYGYVGFNALVKNRLVINFTGGGLMAFSTPQVGLAPQTMQTRQFFYINSAYASYPFGRIEAPFMRLQAGYFPYKYNPDARNLGEYMFRSNTYPLVIYSDFDCAQTNLMGFRLNVRLLNGMVENDLLLHSELYGLPVQDWSVSDIFSSVLFGALTLSGGVSFSHYLSVYQGIYPPQTIDRYFYPQNLSGAEKQSFYIRNGSDSVLFDWKSVKTMARLSFDPKKFINFNFHTGFHDFQFGKEDLKLYAETDIIGLKNYPLYYNHRQDRMLTAFGVNIPGFNVIDIINLEFEYCHNNTAFSDGNLYSATLNSTSIIPLDTNSSYYKLNRAPWRWSLYLKKTLVDGHVSFIGQVARDHKKINFYYFDLLNMSFIEALPTPKDLWWTLKTEFKF